MVDIPRLPGRAMPIYDPLLIVAQGILPGVSFIHKFGANPSSAADVDEDIWDLGGDYTWATTADITHISQAVDQVAMRGGQIEVQGLDINWEMVVQTVLLDGTLTTTPVALDTPLLRVFRMTVQENVVSDQIINLKNVGGTVTYAAILDDHNQTLMAVYTVPAGKTAYVTRFYADTVPATNQDPLGVDFHFWIADRANGYEFVNEHARGVSQGNPAFDNPFIPYHIVPEKHDIKITAKPGAKAALVHGGFDIILVDNPV